MKSRLPILLLGLVVFATALLSLLAARSLRRDALLARQDLAEQADHAVRAAVQQIQDRLMAELDHVRATMSDAAAARGDQRLIESLATRIRDTRPLVDQVYLFMNPWGLMWPTETNLTPTEVQFRQELLETLRRLTATAGPEDRLAFTLHGAPHLFAALEGRKVFYVGCVLNPAAVAAVVDRAMRDAEGGGLSLSLRGWGWGGADGTGAPGGVILRDPFGPSRDLDTGREHGAAEALAVRALPEPLSEGRLLAQARSLEVTQRGARVRTQLYGWGIVMLAVGIVGGVAWLWLEAGAEIRRARAGSEFAIGVSHDLRTPIASVRMLAESLLLGHVATPERRQEFLRTIITECERLGQLTERVLYLFRFGQDAVWIQPRPADPAAEVSAVVDTFRARYPGESEALPRPDVRLQVGPLPGPVRLDPLAFNQVVLNLLDNAVKYGGRSTPLGDRGRMPIDVGLEGESRARRLGWPRRDWVRLTVRDYGPGLSPRERRRVFRRFYRVARAPQGHIAGLGLGLAVCKHAIQAHGGWMRVRGPADGGCAFDCFLPVARQPAATGGKGCG